MIKDTINNLILQEFSGLSDPQKTALSEFAQASVSLSIAADNYDDRSAANNGDDDAEQAAAEALVRIAGNIAKTVTPADRTAFISDLKALYDDPDSDLEAVGETLLDAAVAYREKANAVAALFPTE